MTIHKKVFDQLVGKLRTPKFGNYFTYCWAFVYAIIQDPNFRHESLFEISGFYTKSGNPILIDTEIPSS